MINMTGWSYSMFLMHSNRLTHDRKGQINQPVEEENVDLLPKTSLNYWKLHFHRRMIATMCVILSLINAVVSEDLLLHWRIPSKGWYARKLGQWVYNSLISDVLKYFPRVWRPRGTSVISWGLMLCGQQNPSTYQQKGIKNIILYDFKNPK